MELQEWELRELERLRSEREENLPNLFFETTDRAERKKILERIKEREGETDFAKICEELYEHRYVSKEKKVDNIDYAIRGWVNIKFLPDFAKGFFSKKKLPQKISEVMTDLGYDICEKYGSLGREILFKELCNVVRVYIYLCHQDKMYGSVLFGFGKKKPDTMMSKIGQEIVSITYTIPKTLGMAREFEQLAQAAKTVFVEQFPNKAMFYEKLLDESDERVKP